MDGLRRLAGVIVERCCRVKPGERVLIEVTGCEDALAAEVIRAVYGAGGEPFTSSAGTACRPPGSSAPGRRP